MSWHERNFRHRATGAYSFTAVTAKHRAKLVRDKTWPRRCRADPAAWRHPGDGQAPRQGCSGLDVAAPGGDDARVLTGGVIPLTNGDAAANAVAAPTTSYYESSASTPALGSQGLVAGQVRDAGTGRLGLRPARIGRDERRHARFLAELRFVRRHHRRSRELRHELLQRCSRCDETRRRRRNQRQLRLGSALRRRRVRVSRTNPVATSPGAKSSPTRWSNSMPGRRTSPHRMGSPTRCTSGPATTPSLRSTRASTTPST